MSRALEGLRILDLSRLLPGPYCTLMLADFGAEVIKVEEPQQGDYGRWSEPLIEGIGARHLLLNRNKKSLTLDLKSKEGQRIFHDLAKDADVVLEGFRPGTTKRLNVDYGTLSVINPRLVYCSLTGFGQSGPYAQYPGHDINYVSYAGILGMNGGPERPVVPSVQIADLGGGLMALVGILLALQARERTGEGQYVDVSMLDGAVSWLYTLANEYFAYGEAPSRENTRLSGSLARYEVYETGDGKWIAIGALEEKFWKRFCELVGHLEWTDLLHGSDEQQDQLREQLRVLFRQKDQQYWLSLLAGEDTCVSPVYDIEEVFADPHVLHRSMYQTVTHPSLGAVSQIGVPIKMSKTPGEICDYAPKLGEHTNELLDRLGYTRQQREELRIEGTI